MADGADSSRVTVIQDHIRVHVAADRVRVTQHAQQEMVEDDIALDAILAALRNPSLIEDYPEHSRGACCLVLVWLHDDRPVNVVCTTSLPVLVVITVYEPKRPKWSSPTIRGRYE